MPVELIARANEVLLQLEEKSEARENISDKVKTLNSPKMQLSIFDTHSQTFDEIRKMLSAIDINRLTPVEALMKLNEIKNMIK